MESLYGLLGIPADSTMSEIGDALEQVFSSDIDKKQKDIIYNEAQKLLRMGKEQYDIENKFTIENEQIINMVNNHTDNIPKHNSSFGIEDVRYKLREIRKNNKNRKNAKRVYEDSGNSTLADDSFSPRM